MYNLEQFTRFITGVLYEYNLYSDVALKLLLGTSAQESGFGYYLRQNVKNFDIDIHALGAYQMEKNTFEWLRDVYKNKYPDIKDSRHIELEYDLKLSTLFCRLRYYIVAEPLPKTIEGVRGIAEYWKQHYNTPKGKGTVQEFINNYEKFVKSF